jgi:integrase
MASVRKRSWKTKDGVKSAWQATYSDQYGKKATKTFDLKKEAHDWLAKTQVDVKAGLHTRDYGSITVRELAERWLEKAKTDGRRAGTLYLYRCRVENYITGRRGIPGRSDVEPSLIANIKLSRLGKSHVHDFVDELRRKTTKHSAYQVWRNLKEMLWYAYDRGWVERNVAIRVKFGKPEQRQLEIGRDIPTEPEVLQLLDYADEWHGFFTLAAFAGLRAGEIRALRQSDVNLRQPHPEINVRRNVDFWHTETRPKSDAGQRKVPVFPPVFEVLSKLMDQGDVVRCCRGSPPSTMTSSCSRIPPREPIGTPLTSLELSKRRKRGQASLMPRAIRSTEARSTHCAISSPLGSSSMAWMQNRCRCSWGTLASR